MMYMTICQPKKNLTGHRKKQGTGIHILLTFHVNVKGQHTICVQRGAYTSGPLVYETAFVIHI